MTKNTLDKTPSGCGPKFGVEPSTRTIVHRNRTVIVQDTAEHKSPSGNIYRVPLYQPYVIRNGAVVLSERRLPYSEAFDAASKMAQVGRGRDENV